MISKIEVNDSGFTGIWSKSLKLDCGTLYLNPELADDLFFNKLSNVTCINEQMIEKSMDYFQKNNTISYVYSLNYPQFQTMLEKKGFVYHDTQHALKKIHCRKENLMPSKSLAIQLVSGLEFSVMHMIVRSGQKPYLRYLKTRYLL